ncbi:uncharacterized protein LOC109859772 isoform X2 [Pseudomyrmex gracilis]|uniref:uncharacterized protein LOC109859772 isoform X2 n=1 Tax=Pseudomyrmex gracilis TaxID=219809 RepID=UPI000994B4ED|nr:uncharacterized protein LOC109859772 isoform X2 [Pseudomyrmex gracilis]
MILEIEEDLRDFATVYKKDYSQKKAEKLTKYRSLIDYPPFNILSGPYKQYLNTRLENQLLPHIEQSEDPEDNLNRMRDKFPHLKKTLPQIVPDENIIEREKKISRKSVYQVDYLKEVDHVIRDVKLPEDWMIPETLQKRSYRNPWMIATKDLLKRPKSLKPRDNLDPNVTERAILRVTTGNSEYIDAIGAIGERIMQQASSELQERVKSQVVTKF